MAKSIGKINSGKASTDNPLGKSPPGDKTLRFDPGIRYYEMEFCDKTEEVEEE